MRPSKAKIPVSWKEAYITLLPKEGTDQKQIKNYRPISLLNTDYKIFMNIIAERLKRILNYIIHPDQNGFLPDRQIRYNLRIVVDTLEYYEAHPEKQMAFVFLDAQKAFDNLNWQFMIEQIKIMKFGTNFEKMIETIYKIQRAKIIINGDMTNTFQIKKGVRQGCPLSPLLFILTLDINRIRKNSEIKGLKIRREEYKAQAFADDVVLIIEEPLEMGPRLLGEIGRYGEVPGFKLNKGKTKMQINLTETQKNELEKELGLQIVKKT